MPSAELEKVIAWSPDRTVLTRSTAGGNLEVVKVYERGPFADAEAEAGLGGQLSIEGLVRYRGAQRDPESGRPQVLLDYHPGVNLHRWVGEHGPPRVAAATRVAAAVARTLASMHAAQVDSAPRGAVHGDVKPSNILLLGPEPDPATSAVMLLDLEHAHAIGAAASGQGSFTGGTHGFAPPEAYAGASPTTAFDAFGLGATLHVLLTGASPYRQLDPTQLAEAMREGHRRRRWLQGVPAGLQALVEACLAPTPERRPPLASLAEQLERFADVIASDLDEVLVQLRSGDVAGAESALATAADDGDRQRRDQVTRYLARLRRLAARVPAPDTTPLTTDLDALAVQLLERAGRTRRWLDRFPNHAPSRAHLQASGRALARLLQDTPERVAAHKRAAAFERAEALLENTRRAYLAVQDAGASIEQPEVSQARNIGPMQRDPLRYLELAQQDVKDAARTHERLLQRMHSAEVQLDLTQLASVLDSAASIYSGANEVVAALKDRLHQLSFYLERLAQPVEAIERLKEQLDLAGAKVDLSALAELRARCAEATTTSADTPPAAARRETLQGLRNTLRDLHTEFPHLEPASRDAMGVLDHACGKLTECAWTQLGDGQQKLSSVPIPIRPLQSIVNRIDALRHLEVLVDLDERPRARLLDEHERLRLRVEQARTTRDQLARGAQEAFQRGHLTTALYDMERAVDQFADESGELEQDGQQLAEQIEEAKQKRRDLEEAAQANQRAAARYLELQDDPTSTDSARLEALEQRRQALRYLIDNLQRERVEPYIGDLADVEIAMLHERAAGAEMRLTGLTDPAEREALARQTLASLGEADFGDNPPPRLQSLLHRWENRLARAERETATRRRQQRLRLAAIAAALVAAMVAAWLAMR
ncbi:MAG: protein kinase [Planctomycetota bacterium]